MSYIDETGIDISLSTQLKTQLDTKLSNYYPDWDNYTMIVEDIPTYLSRIISDIRSAGVPVTMLIPKEDSGISGTATYNYDTFDGSNYDTKYYAFIDGLADENFIEITAKVFLYFAYGSSLLGADFTTINNPTLKYAAILKSLKEIKIPVVGDFVGLWYKRVGEDGLTPNIGLNGNWFVGTVDTGIKAQGENGLSPNIGLNGNWFVGTVDTGIKAQGPKGDDGLTPSIGLNGNWFIGITDTGIKAQAEDGLSPTIGLNGNWFIGTVDTGIKAQGPKGDKGDSIKGDKGADGIGTEFLVNQSHTFIVGNAIKQTDGSWILACADTRFNAGTVGIVSEIIDSNNFIYKTAGLLFGSFINGANYFLSTTTSGLINICDDNTEWHIGEVYEFIGTGIPEGLMIEIDVGHEIVKAQQIFEYCAYASDAIGTDFTKINDPLLKYTAIILSENPSLVTTIDDFVGLWYKRGGDDGHSTYINTAYASDAIGTGFSTIDDPSLDYIATFYSDTFIPTSRYISHMFTGIWHKRSGGSGISSHTYIAYASDNIGTGWSTIPTNLLKYRAEIQSNIVLTPIVSDFASATWIKYIGDNASVGYLEYVGLISQVGTNAPTAIIHKNDLGAITWVYVGVGIFRATSAGLFTADKMSPVDDIIMDQIGNLYTLNWIDSSNFELRTYGYANITQLANGICNKRYINFCKSLL